MPGFSDQTLEEIRARCDIVEIISQRVPLKRAGSDFKACCPFHHEKTPSFIVSPSRRAFHCFGCGAQGDVFKFLMMSDGMTFPDAVKHLAERCGVVLEEREDAGAARRRRLLSLHEDVTAFYQRCLASLKDAQAARDYLEKRKLDAETVGKFRIGFAPARPGVMTQWAAKNGYSMEEMVEGGLLSPPRSAGDSFYDKFRGRLMFPICDQNGHVVAFSGRILDANQKGPKYYNSTETLIFRKSRVLYGLSFAKRAITREPRRRALVCEGQIDVIRCHACGFATAVASQGTAFTEEHVSLLKSYADSATLVFDGDAAGMKAAIRTGRLFLQAGMPVQAALLPEGEDPDSFLRDRPPEEFQELLDNPLSLVALHVRAAGKKDGSGAIESLAHLMDELFETFASSSKAVFRSFMIQEAAELLKMPQQAIEDDFAAFLANRERRHVAAHPASGRQDRGGGQAAVSAGTPAAADAGRSPDNGPGAEAGASAETAAAPGRPQKIRLPETPLLAIADVLVKLSTTQGAESADAARFLSQWMPPREAGSTVGAIVDAALSDCLEGGGKLAGMAASGSPEERAVISFLAGRPSPILQNSMPVLDALKELVFSFWTDFIRDTRRKIQQDNPEDARRRLLLSSALLRLESAPDWESRSQIIAQFL